MGWHAKPLPKDMAEGVVKDLQARIMNSSKRLYPTTPIEDAPPVSLRNVRMPSAPAYKQGEKVTYITCISPYTVHMWLYSYPRNIDSTGAHPIVANNIIIEAVTHTLD